MAVKVLHIIQELSLGGAARALFAAAKYGKRLGDYEHTAAGLLPGDPNAVALAQSEGVNVFPSNEWSAILKEIENSDIVQLQWWNSPEMDAFLRLNLPACRLSAWTHVGGHLAPQEVTDELISFCDLAIACSPYTFECAAFKRAASLGESAIAMAYGPADFERLSGFTPKKHDRFTIGYIGTLDQLKMYPDYIAMCSRVMIPNVRFIIGGNGDDTYLRNEAAKLGIADRFEFRGYIKDLKGTLEEIDILGHALCKETYAASEINLQEAMFCGIAPVVFPYGGVKRLVIHNETGIVVESSSEYVAAIERLYHHRDELKRLGENASQYAKKYFGAENAAKIIDEHYKVLLTKPKRTRTFSDKTFVPTQGANRFVMSIPGAAKDFIVSANSQSEDELLEVEERILHSSELMRLSAIVRYQRTYPTDPWLNLWAGLVRIGIKGPQAMAEAQMAMGHMVAAIQGGINHWRIFWYLARACKIAGDPNAAKKMLAEVLSVKPDFLPAKEMMASI